jgi:hypothetical protein
VVRESGAEEASVRSDFERLYHELQSRRRVFLRHKDVPAYVQWQEILERIKHYPPITAAA